MLHGGADTLAEVTLTIETLNLVAQAGAAARIITVNLGVSGALSCSDPVIQTLRVGLINSDFQEGAFLFPPSLRWLEGTLPLPFSRRHF